MGFEDFEPNKWAMVTHYKGVSSVSGRWVYGTLSPEDVTLPADKVARLITVQGVTGIIKGTLCLCSGIRDSHGNLLYTDDYFIAQDNNAYVFTVKYGRCGGVRNTESGIGYMGFYVEGCDESTKKAMKYGLRSDIFYYIGSFSCQLCGNLHTEPFIEPLFWKKWRQESVEPRDSSTPIPHLDTEPDFLR